MFISFLLMDTPLPSTSYSLENIKELAKDDILGIFDFDKDDEIGYQPNKRPKTTYTVDKKLVNK